MNVGVRVWIGVGGGVVRNVYAGVCGCGCIYIYVYMRVGVCGCVYEYMYEGT